MSEGHLGYENMLIFKLPCEAFSSGGDGGSSRIAGFFGVPSSLQLITGLLQHSSFMLSPKRY